MNSSGDMTRCVVPSRQAALSFNTTCPAALVHALVGQRRAGDVAAQLFQCLAVVGAAAHGSVQAETADVGAQRLLEVRFPGQGALHSQHLLAGARAEGDAISTGRSLQRPERTGLVRIAVVVGYVGRTRADGAASTALDAPDIALFYATPGVMIHFINGPAVAQLHAPGLVGGWRIVLRRFLGPGAEDPRD
jgi:hypothetical protein